MNKFIKSWILLIVLTQANSVLGKEKVGLQELDMPAEIIECNSTAEVKPYLSNKNELMRMWAVRRVVQLGDPNAVSFLMETFAKEPNIAGIDSRPYVKMEIITALGKIGGDGAKASLLRIFNTYWERGPKSKKYAWEDGDYIHVVPATLQALYTWRHEREIFDMYGRIYLEERNIPDWPTRQKAYELYLGTKMEMEGIIGLEKEANYLLSNLTSKGLDWVKGKNGVKTLQAIKDGAILTKLIKCGEAALPYIDRELSKVSPTSEKRRYEGLSYVKKIINSRLERERSSLPLRD